LNFKIIFLLGAILILSVKVNAQIIVSKKNISVNDSITVYFNPTLGNKALNGVDPIYIYTGLITLKSENKTHWQYIPMQWGENNEKFKMTRINDTCYYYGINIKKFYYPKDDEKIFNIGLYFRNTDYSKIGMTEENEYFFIDMVQKGFDFKAYSLENNQLIINTDLFIYTLDLYDNNLIKIDFQKDSNLSASQKLSVLNKQKNIKFGVTDSDTNLVILNNDINVTINKNPVSFTIVRLADTIIKNLTINSNFGWHYEFNSESRIYGGGSFTYKLDKNSTYMFLYNSANFGYPTVSPYTNYNYPKSAPFSSWNIPFFVSSELYSVYFDSPGNSSIDFGKYSKGKVEYYSYSSPLAVYINIGDTFEELVTNFNLLTGRMPVPAYWSLGFLQSNFVYSSQNDIIRILPLYQQYKIPCEAIMLDYFWMGGPEKIGEFDWDYENNFKRPNELLDSMKKYNMKCLLISHSYLTLESKNFQNFYDKNLLATHSDGKPYILEGFRSYPFGFIDLFNPSADEEFWKLFKAKYDEGIAGWWNDLSEPEMHPQYLYHYGGFSAFEIHNLYPYKWSEILFEKFSDYKPNERLVHFSRGGTTGMQKFGTICWTGDVLSSYGGLQMQIPIMLGLGINGIILVGSDVGGFYAIHKNSQLYTRWLQFACFSPILRPHGNGVQQPEPFNHDEPYRSICRNYIELRYKLLPYLYTLCYNATQTGRPIVMQMDYFDIQNKFLQDKNTQYYFGKDFIIAPILDSVNTREVIFPEGIWYEFKNNKRYIGEQTINVDYDINDIPIFVRGGAIIPTTYSVLSTELFKYDYYKFLCYSDTAITESEGKMYVDNGRNPKAIEQKAYELITVKMKNLSDKLTFVLKKEGNGFQEFSSAVFEMQVFNTKFYDSVILNDGLLPVHSLYSDFENSNMGVYYDTKERILHIKYPWNHQQENFIECVRSNNVILTKNIKIYPNPTNGKLNINILETDFSSNSFDMALYSEIGDKILSRTYNHQKAIELDLTKLKLSFGVYFVEIKIANKTLKYKIIYER
jgi:alpha-glucosidase (family GH31 glycosyl hydrolase)